MVKEIEVITVPGDKALSELMEGLSEAEATGYHPILVGDVDDYDQILEGLETGDSSVSILQKSNHVDLTNCFATHAPPANENDTDLNSAGYRGIVTHLDSISGVPKSKILIRNFKVPAAWHSFAHLAWGGWRSCPSPEVHCAIHRHWADCYGANVVSITGSKVQCTVSQPPTDKQSALELAQHQISYCRSLAASTTELANHLLNAKFWYFCWE